MSRAFLSSHFVTKIHSVTKQLCAYVSKSIQASDKNRNIFVAHKMFCKNGCVTSSHTSSVKNRSFTQLYHCVTINLEYFAYSCSQKDDSHSLHDSAQIIFNSDI